METRHMDTETYARHLAWERWLLQAMRDMALARSCDRAKRGVVLVRGKEVKFELLDSYADAGVWKRRDYSRFDHSGPWNESVPMLRSEPNGRLRVTGHRRDKLAAEDDQ